ncbi:35084_t:CDS:2, partial [Gigaspora margarita]
ETFESQENLQLRVNVAQSCKSISEQEQQFTILNHIAELMQLYRIKDIINEARQNNKIVRVIGSKHSYPSVIWGKNESNILISLNKYRGVEIKKNENNENIAIVKTDENGYVLLVTGGITHQTVRGFISTGSAGGSLSHSFGNQVIGIQLIDGNGDIHDLKYSNNDNSKFLAAGVSMGLLGVITKVTFRLEPHIKIGSPIDFFGDGDPSQGIPSISDFLSNARRIPVPKHLPPDPYPQLSLLQQRTVRLILTHLNENESKISSEEMVKLLDLFMKIGTEYFQDKWWTGLPMDNVMNDLQQLFDGEFKAISNFFTEIYATGRSKFWLSLAYNKDIVRIDVHYFSGNTRGIPKDHFKFYWDILSKYGFRCHWGKYMPDNYGDQVSKLYPQYNQWMNIRRQIDPKQIFVTPYWRKLLKIPNPDN